MPRFVTFYKGLLMPDPVADKLDAYAHVPTMVALPQLAYQDPSRTDWPSTTVGMTLVGLPTDEGTQVNDGLDQQPGMATPHRQARSFLWSHLAHSFAPDSLRAQPTVRCRASE